MHRISRVEPGPQHARPPISHRLASIVYESSLLRARLSGRGGRANPGAHRRGPKPQSYSAVALRVEDGADDDFACGQAAASAQGPAATVGVGDHAAGLQRGQLAVAGAGLQLQIFEVGVLDSHVQHLGIEQRRLFSLHGRLRGFICVACAHPAIRYCEKRIASLPTTAESVILCHAATAQCPTRKSTRLSSYRRINLE